jgi:hypothetical protein
MRQLYLIDMSGSAKRHHWIPVCHTSLWVDEAGCVTTITKRGEIWRTTPANTAVISHYNSVNMPDGTRDPALEVYFADEVESPVAPVLARIATETRRDRELEARFDHALLHRERRQIERDGFFADGRAFSASFSLSDRRALARYVASLIVRVPSYKDELNSERMLENVARVLGLDAQAARFQTDRLHVDIIRRHLHDYARRLENCGYVLVDAPDGAEFIMGDTPVIPAALGFGEAEVICPITPKRALLVVSNYAPPFVDRMGIFRSRPASVRAFNKTMVQNAEREIFCRAPFPINFVMKHLGTRQVRLEPNLETAGGAHCGRGPMLDRPAAG